MKKVILSLIILFLSVVPVFADASADALKFFDSYVIAANTYKPDLVSYYSPNATIIRVVIRPDGTKGKAVFKMKDYETQLKLGAATAKFRNYKNYYTNRKVTKVANGYKITCLRQPSLDKYKLPAHFIVSKASGSWKIVEESMDTKVQIFNHYVQK